MLLHLQQYERKLRKILLHLQQDERKLDVVLIKVFILTLVGKKKDNTCRILDSVVFI
jgi:hypothetical protein